MNVFVGLIQGLRECRNAKQFSLKPLTRYFVYYFVSVGLSLGLVATTVGQAQAVGDLGASALPTVVSNFVERFNLNPGEEVTGMLVLEGTGERKQTLSLRVRDMIQVAGEKQYRTAGTFERSNASWITGLPSQVTLEPGERLSLPYRLKMPATQRSDASGTYYSIILIEPVAVDPFVEEDDGSYRAATETTFVLKQRLRYGIQIISETTESGSVALNFVNPALDSKAEGVNLRATLEHRGAQGVRVNVSLELFDSEGNLVSTVMKDDDQYIYPQSSQVINLDLGSVAAGTYDAILIADAGPDNVFGVRYNLEVE